jgi:hypothetical protein
VDDPLVNALGFQGMWIKDPLTGIVAIEIYHHDSSKIMYDTIAHEIGHNAAENLEPELVNQWNTLYECSSERLISSGGEQDEFVTEYATITSAEDFAETYSFYVNDPEFVKAVCPQKYDFMKNYVFDGLEFVP